MELPNYCPICGDSTTPTSETLGDTNRTLFVKDEEYRTVFKCFNKLFEIRDLLWFEKAFVFCSECKRQLKVVSELGEVLKEVERRLKDSQKVVRDKLKRSEGKFESSGIYRRDKRYWKVRGQFLNKERLSSSFSSGEPPENPAAETSIPDTGNGASDSPNYVQLDGRLVEVVKIEVELPIQKEEVEEDHGDDNFLCSEHSTLDKDPFSSSHKEDTILLSTGNQNPNQDESQDKQQRAKRRRAPPKRFDPDEYELNTKLKRNKSDSESSQTENLGMRNIVTMLIGSGANGDEQVVKVEEVQVHEYFDEGEEFAEAFHFEAENDGENEQEQNVDDNEDDDSDFKIEEEEERVEFEFENIKEKNSEYFGTDDPKDYECVLCVCRHRNKKQFEDHIIEFHQSKENYKALAEIKAAEAAARWMTPGLPVVTYFGITLTKVGDGTNYQCSKCGEVLSNPFATTRATGLRNHVTQEHTELYKCGQCGQCFCDSKSLKFHLGSDHLFLN